MAFPFTSRFSRNDPLHRISAEFVEYLRQVVNTIKGTGITITKTGTGRDWELAINVDGATVELNAGVLRIKSGGVDTTQLANGAVTGTQLAASVAGNGLAGGGGSALSVNVDNTTIEISGDSLRVKALGIGTSQIAANAVTSAQTSGTTGSHLGGTPQTLNFTNGLLTSIT